MGAPAPARRPACADPGRPTRRCTSSPGPPETGKRAPAELTGRRPLTRRLRHRLPGPDLCLLAGLRLPAACVDTIVNDYLISQAVPHSGRNASSSRVTRRARAGLTQIAAG